MDSHSIVVAESSFFFAVRMNINKLVAKNNFFNATYKEINQSTFEGN